MKKHTPQPLDFQQYPFYTDTGYRFAIKEVEIDSPLRHHIYISIEDIDCPEYVYVVSLHYTTFLDLDRLLEIGLYSAALKPSIPRTREIGQTAPNKPSRPMVITVVINHALLLSDLEERGVLAQIEG